MNKNLLIAFAGALVIAILVAMLMSTLLGGSAKKKQARTAEVKQIQILVASKPIAVGQTLSSDTVKWKSWPETATLPGAIVRTANQKLSDVANGRAMRAFVVEEPIVSSSLVTGDGGFTAARLDPGMRAMSVRASAITAAGGLIRPGDFVDVILVYDLEMKARSSDPAVRSAIQGISDRNLEKYGGQTILQNVRVLAVNQNERPPSGNDKAGGNTSKVSTVTLEVNSRGAEKLAVGSKTGTLHFSLRGLGDETQFDEKRSSTTDMRMILIDDEIIDQINDRANVRMISGGVPVQ